MKTQPSRPMGGRLLSLLVAALASHCSWAPEARLELEPGDHVAIIGNTLAERMQYFGHFETLLHARFPEHQLLVRNLGYSADEIAFRPRSLNWGSPDDHLSMWRADVILACFGFNESFAGPAGLAKFEADLEEFIRHTKEQRYNGKTAPRLALISPIAHEDLGNPNYPDGGHNNANLQAYTEAMSELARRHEVPFVDLFTPSLQLMRESQQPLTINGVHLSDFGDSQVAPILDQALFGSHPHPEGVTAELRAEVNEKNLFFFHRYRAVNGYYIWGGRSQRDHGNPPFTDSYVLENERGKLDDMVAIRDQRVWDTARGEPVSATIDDSTTRPVYDVPTNFTEPVRILPPEEAVKQFQLPPGYAINLFAGEGQFPELENPVQLNFDARGRLWVLTMPDYPMFQPPNRPNDRLLILEDVDQDGRADQLTVFADGLHVPTGFELGDGGVYLAQQPNLLFLKDTDGDDRADLRELILHGFDSADSHHSIGAFTWGPGGGLYMHEGTFHHTSVETHSGPVRNAHGGVYRFEPTTWKFETFISYNFANPWGHAFDAWGQNFVADASGGNNYFATAFSGRAPQFTGQPDFGPFKYTYRSQMKQFIVKRVRPTAGCEIVSSRHFPPAAQGNFLLNNVIGFQGVLQHRMREQGSGFEGTEIEPLLFSSDRNFRPTDLQFGPDGALYVVDWFNPLIGHMQHNLRDPNRDKSHGRVWRITYPSRPLLTPPKIASEPLPALFTLLESYEDRTRYRVRLELRERETGEVIEALQQWVAELDVSDPNYEHHLLEALWVRQHHNAPDPKLLKRVLGSPDHRARAAATRVLGYWRDRIQGALDILQDQSNDPHPRVRLEAVRAVSFFEEPQAAEVALEILRHPMDYYLDYTLGETIRTLQPYWHPVITSGQPLAAANLRGVEYLLGRLEVAELETVARNSAVYSALLNRPGVQLEYRQEALAGLAALDGTSEISHLLSAIRRLDGGESAEDEQVLAELGRMLEGRSKTELETARGELEALSGAARPRTRRLAQVALIAAEAGVDAAWVRASRSLDTLLDLVQCVPEISDPRTRSAMYPKLEDLLRRPSSRLAALPGGSRAGAEAVIEAAIQALPSIPGHESESLQLLTAVVGSGKLLPAAVRAIGRFPGGRLADADTVPLLEGLLRYLSSLPAGQRTSEDGLAAARLAADLAALLPPEESADFRARLAELAVTVIVIRPLPSRMQYDRTEFSVPAGRPVEIVFENIDIMPHNLIVTAPGALLEVGLAAERMAARPDAFSRQFVPESRKVLFATRMLQPQQMEKLQFTAPKQLGDYPYLCTFPGHWRTMFGTMHVVEDLEEAAPEAVASSEAATGKAREFVQTWTLQDLVGSLRDLDADRDFQNGEHLFHVLTCSKCHQMNGKGGRVGPDLTQVRDKMASGEMDRVGLLREVVEPSAVVAEQYRTQVVKTKAGLLFSGVISHEDARVLRLVANPFESDQADEVPKDSIQDRWESTVSMMPDGLLNTATSRDILDLIAYLATAGGLRPTAGESPGPR